MFISNFILVFIIVLTIREWRRNKGISSGISFTTAFASVTLVVVAVFWFLTFKSHHFSLY